MKNPILVLGAGRSSVSLLEYLNAFSREVNVRFSVADADAENLKLRTSGLDRADCLQFEALDKEGMIRLIGEHRIVISLLPPPMHPLVALACLEVGSNLVTASYESQAMRDLAPEILEKGLVFINECGLDPGIDHMSAMEVIQEIQEKGGRITRFHSYCGGLVADESDDNPFRYKVSWNPRNVVLAGKGGGKFLSGGRVALLPYQRLFSEAEEVNVPGWGAFEAYPNRDSVPYSEIYGFQGIQDLKRGTLRKKGFCSRWNLFVKAGMTDDESRLEFAPGATFFDFLKTFFPGIREGDYQDFFDFAGDEILARDILEMGFLAENPIQLNRTSGSPADYLLDLIVKKWVLKPEDHDLVVMLHEFRYFMDDVEYQTVASFGLKGRDSVHTAMAMTVGLPLGIVAKHLFLRNVTQKGLLLPLHASIFKPVLNELSQLGVQFQVTTQPIQK
jgi:saccharopine dehydrogenase-like NADP-dependent oxidoreductase